ncbi:SNF2 family N-terminal domain-containing protein [Immersiella caudata]|uniref:SNF2 family N-terminal domain-containing protein n=1 Tax=Immersiella caudata TaxID=314043 RepID=A0AA40C349_9PEZI|nr:SNF2 family N-terminal domain-containing protein [Immersiella caudata]
MEPQRPRKRRRSSEAGDIQCHSFLPPAASHWGAEIPRPGTWDEQPESSQNKSIEACIGADLVCFGMVGERLFLLCQDISEFFESNEMFIQDPENCDRRVRYCNPHRLSSADPHNLQWTCDLNPGDLTFDMKDASAGPDILDFLDSQADLTETPQPPAIETLLKRHQKQALTFMLQREKGWTFDENTLDLWDVIDTGRGRFFINRISGAHQNEEPKQFYGGIVADPMGFGKTLTTIALVATDVCGPQDPFSDLNDLFDNHDTDLEMADPSFQTLIVVPPPLLDTWEEQLAEHVIPDGLTWMRYHGKGRTSQSLDFTRSNIVLTTYHTIAADWKSKGSSQDSVLFSARWRRLVLDEAHVIRNSNSQMARSIHELDAKCRWAVTGTPLQNRLKDFSALLKFLQVDPYCDQKSFDRDISHLWKTEQADEARKRLQRLSRCLLLRRPQGTVKLPPRKDLQCEVIFSPEERQLHESIRHRAIEQINAANGQSEEAAGSSTYMNVLQQIEAMRMVCNLGLHYSSRHNLSIGGASISSGSTQCHWTATAQRMFNLRRNISPVQCSVCTLSLETMERLLADSEEEEKPSLFSQCLQFMCSDCLQTAKDRCHCGHTPRCVVAPVSVTMNDLEPSLVAHHRLDPSPGTLYALPTKITALVAQLKRVPMDEKSIVFSTWRMSLDVVEAGLRQAGIQCLRYDGKVPQKERHGVVTRFREDPSVRVLLLTLACGAVGLTLTVASRAYLLEPHWNPTLEDQALARIHRMGQKREVTTVRFYVRDTFEKRVLELQGLKKKLAGLVSAPHDGGTQGELNMSSLEGLRALL